MAGAYGGKGGKGGAPGGKGGARSGNAGARSGYSGARSVNDGAPSGNGGGHSGDVGACSVNDGAPSGNGGTRSGNDGARSGNDGALGGKGGAYSGGTRGRTPKQGFRPPNRQVRDTIDDDTFMTTCGRYSILRGDLAGIIVSVNVRGDGGSRRGHDGSGSRGGHDSSDSRGGHDGTGKRGGHGGHDGSGERGGRGGHDASGRRGGHDGSDRRGGYAGSSSRWGEGDPIADMCGVFRDPSLHTIPDRASNHYSDVSDFENVNHQEDDFEEEADLEDDEHPLSQRSYEGASCDTIQGRVIRRAGEKFEVDHGDVHKSITRILAEHHDGVWMTFRQIPRDVLARMFECFRTRLRWDSASEQLIYEGFINVLKTSYSDIMRHLRITPQGWHQ